MDMNLQKYLSFVKTVEYGSFTRAAEILHYSQSGVSRMIGDLEKDWNMVLLERGKGGVRLTSNGLHMLPYAKELVADYEKMQMQVNALNGMQSGLIRIGTFSSIATHWLPNIIREFQKDYPHIEYELLLGSYAELENRGQGGLQLCASAHPGKVRYHFSGRGSPYGGAAGKSSSGRAGKVPGGSPL